MMARPSRPRLGLRGHLKIGPSGDDEVPGGVRERGDERAWGGDPPPGQQELY